MDGGTRKNPPINVPRGRDHYKSIKTHLHRCTAHPCLAIKSHIQFSKSLDGNGYE